MKYPEMRKELISYMESLSDIIYQKKCWVLGECPEGTHDELDYSIHFLFDDTSLASNPQANIGEILRNESEALAVKRVCGHLDLILGQHGSGLSDAEYISLPEWGMVVESSSEALAILRSY